MTDQPHDQDDERGAAERHVPVLLERCLELLAPALEVEGALAIGNDPDGIVVAADWFAASSCADRLGSTNPWVREPLLEWMVERFESTREFRYEVLGTGASDVRVTRL